MSYLYESDDRERLRKKLEGAGARGICTVISWGILFFSGKLIQLMQEEKYMMILIYACAVPYVSGIIIYMIFLKIYSKNFSDKKYARERAKAVDRKVGYFSVLLFAAMIFYILKFMINRKS